MQLHKINKEQRLYVMLCGCGGYCCYGFDVLDRKGRALTAELATLVKNLPTNLQDRAAKMAIPWTERKGTRKAFNHYSRLLEFAKEINKQTGHRFGYELSKQLVGLGGRRVEVVTTYGETRRFWVGKSTGWAPCHLEIARRNSSGGSAAESEYKSVKVISNERR